MAHSTADLEALRRRRPLSNTVIRRHCRHSLPSANERRQNGPAPPRVSDNRFRPARRLRIVPSRRLTHSPRWKSVRLILFCFPPFFPTFFPSLRPLLRCRRAWKKKQKTKKKQTKRFLSAPGRFAYGDRSHRHHHRHHQIEAVLFFFFFIFCLDRNDRRTSANATLTSRGVDSFRFSHRAAIKSETTTTTFRVEETRDNNETAESS